MNNRLKFLRKPEAPSIPTPGQAYGYEENDDGTLRKQDPPDKDASLGPAFYAPPSELAATRAVKLYKGERSSILVKLTMTRCKNRFNLG